MRFYYMSVFSLIFLAVLYLVALGVFWFVWSRLLKRKFSGPVVWTVIAVVLVAPWTEELWIAYNFGQLCRKDAGIFINKTVEVEGFYADPATGNLELVKSGGYRFLESRTEKGIQRIEYGDADFLRQATARYQQENPKKDIAGQDYFRVRLDANTDALVYPKKGDSWRITKLDKPTARYYFLKDQGMQLTHKVGRQMSKVVDSKSSQELGHYTRYYRGPYWFYIGLDRPNIGCDGPDGGPRTSGSFLIYDEILKPIQNK